MGLWGPDGSPFRSHNGPFFPGEHWSFVYSAQTHTPPRAAQNGWARACGKASVRFVITVKAARRLLVRHPPSGETRDPVLPEGPAGARPRRGHAGLSDREVAPLDKEGYLQRECQGPGVPGRGQNRTARFVFSHLSGGGGRAGRWAGRAGHPPSRPVATARPGLSLGPPTSSDTTCRTGARLPNRIHIRPGARLI